MSPTSGLRQFRSGWVESKMWRYHWPSGDFDHAGPPKTDFQLFGGSSGSIGSASRNR